MLIYKKSKMVQKEQMKSLKNLILFKTGLGGFSGPVVNKNNFYYEINSNFQINKRTY